MEGPENTNTQKSADEGWLGLLLPLLVAAVVAVSASVLYQKFFTSPPASAPSQVLVFSLADWLEVLPEGASESQINEVLDHARKAADQAAKEGYMVVRGDQLVAFPNSARLKPGMYTDFLDESSPGQRTRP